MDGTTKFIRGNNLPPLYDLGFSAIEDIEIEQYLSLEEKNKGEEELDDSEMLISGALNLINYLICEQFEKGQAVETLIFLDKGARLGEYVYRCLYNELSLKEILPEGMLKPKALFVNIGNEKEEILDLTESLPHLCGRRFNFGIKSEILFGRKFRKNLFKGKVLIVDERVIRGRATETAIALFAKWYKGGIRDDVSAISLFRDSPWWKFYSEMTNGGVKDLELDEKFIEILDKMHMYDFELFYSTIKNSKKSEFFGLVEMVKGRKYKVRGMKRDMRNFINIIKKYIKLGLDFDMLYKYFESAGGFLVLPNPEYFPLNNGYRFDLKQMIIAATDRVKQ